MLYKFIGMLKVPGKKTEAMRQAPASVKGHILLDGELIKWPSRVAVVGDGKKPKRNHHKAGFVACCCKCCCVLQMCVFIVSNIAHVSKHCVCLKVLQCQTLLLHLSLAPVPQRTFCLRQLRGLVPDFLSKCPTRRSELAAKA